MLALLDLSVAALQAGGLPEALSRARQAHLVDAAGIPGWVARFRGPILTAVLIECGDWASAQRTCADGLATSRQAGYLQGEAYLLCQMSILDVQADRLADAWEHLKEAVALAERIGERPLLLDCLDQCGQLCVTVRRWAEAITVWAARAACLPDEAPAEQHRRQGPLRQARQAVGPAAALAAEERGRTMTAGLAAEFVTMLADSHLPDQPGPKAITQLTPREIELITLVAEGRTDRQIALQLHISQRTVSSHLDRIRDKTGCRRRADLTRLALLSGLV